MEIEKKYLLKKNISLDEFKNDTFAVFNIEQFYVIENDVEVRYRKLYDSYSNESYFKTIKKGTGLVREEKETEIKEKDYLYVLNNFPIIGRIIKKTRYLIDLDDGFAYELDVFQNNEFSDLMLLEVEFKSEKEAKEHSLPPKLKSIVEREVTGEKKYVNSFLAKSFLNKKDLKKNNKYLNDKDRVMIYLEDQCKYYKDSFIILATGNLIKRKSIKIKEDLGGLDMAEKKFLKDFLK